ncbi:MAG TPA: hypothetical protein PLG23_16130 [Thermoflexales bacterium]|jgi:hypothetical protein|nr:hypothetical protein [Anaerolineae bacterium]HQV28691.1 hypothetical protein [Thermoflexales bacterium]HQX12098.1 hypothetical protein [Thermoflexales bacterium]HQY25337.1 hypothetical protein [Thermoflexales bacterium]HQZ54994.1 hypothetical protein [Thermoflexales bacterium]
MEKPKQVTRPPGRAVGRSKLGSALLLAFVAVSVALIIVVWRDNIAGEENRSPSYYRDTVLVDPSARATATAAALPRR